MVRSGREMEHRPGVIDVSPYPMQPWLDVAEGGWAVVVHTDNDPALAESLAAECAARPGTCAMHSGFRTGFLRRRPSAGPLLPKAV